MISFLHGLQTRWPSSIKFPLSTLRKTKIWPHFRLKNCCHYLRHDFIDAKWDNAAPERLLPTLVDVGQYLLWGFLSTAIKHRSNEKKMEMVIPGLSLWVKLENWIGMWNIQTVLTCWTSENHNTAEGAHYQFDPLTHQKSKPLMLRCLAIQMEDTGKQTCPEQTNIAKHLRSGVWKCFLFTADTAK